ncbi:MAG TPA: PIG-L family deacetylase [Planctomycetota bacterium]|nr:PIG-L family deacetylase [Planctomycetota bacterium]
MSKPYSILAVGAHMDDCWLGMGGVALRAVRAGHKVTMVTACGSYEWYWPVAGREAEVIPAVQRIAERAGMRHIQLKHHYMRLQNTPELVDQIAQIVFETKPEIVFCHAEDESNQDHTALGAATRIAAIHGECFVKPSRGEFGYVSEVYQYTTGWQATNFQPDTYSDYTDVAFDVFEICNHFDDIYAKKFESPDAERSMIVTDKVCDNRKVALNSHARFKFAQSLVNGKGTYAEAFKSYTRLPLQYRRLAKI